MAYHETFALRLGGSACPYTAHLGLALPYKMLLLEMNRKEPPSDMHANLGHAFDFHGMEEQCQTIRFIRSGSVSTRPTRAS